VAELLRVRFGDIVFDAAVREVRRAGEIVHLQRKAFDLLRFLLERRPAAVSKDEIHAAIWPGTFVSEVTLQGLISEIRDALGDGAREPRFVRTVHGYGYSFCGAVSPLAEAERQAKSTRAWLVWEGGRVGLAEGENVIGRGEDARVDLDSPTVSRRHARIVVASDGATLEDLESKNGTYLGARQVSQPVPLCDGDQIRIGAYLITFRVATPATSTASETPTAGASDRRR
jgi:DNA-binding winged helix-turn-helix (wHTH) protein